MTDLDIEKLVAFCRSLREHGLSVTPAEVVTAAAALQIIDTKDRAEVFLSLRNILTTSVDDFPVFENLFAAYWDQRPARIVEHQKQPTAPARATGGLAFFLEHWPAEIRSKAQPVNVPGASDTEARAEKDFAAFSHEELEEISRIARRMARRLAKSRSRRWRPVARGRRVNLRRSLRLSLKTGGELIELSYQERRPKRTKLFVICDVSGSMDIYSRLLLQFIYGLQNSFAKVESFVFATSLARITGELKGKTYQRALDRLSVNVRGWSGGTRIGASLASFNQQWLRRIDKRTGESKSVAPPKTWGSNNEKIRTAFEMPYIISPHNHTRLYVLANVLFKSENKGDSYTPVSGDLTRALDRDTFTVMGRKWGNDAVNKNLYTNDLSVGTALDESTLEEGLLYVGTDDGLIQVSENAGKTWRQMGTFPGVPEFTTVSKLLASRIDTNVVYAAFNNMLHGDFKPYVLKSSDRGRTWTSIRGNLPDREEVWTLAEDGVNKNMLFAGTEHGVFVTFDGGGNWQRLRAGIPSVAVRDLQIQRREIDLVAATFGRGLYIIDDYSPLRAVAARTNADGGLIPPRPTRLFVESPFQRAGFGNGLFSGDNPPYGALLSYTLRDATPTGTRTVLVIKDAAGKTINEINGPGGAGLNRAVWNLRRASDTTSARANAGRGGRGGGGAPTDEEGAPQGRGGGRGGPPPPGPFVVPGTYTIQLARRNGTTLTPIGAPQRLHVIPLNAK